jgi:hypothetical protein
MVEIMKVKSAEVRANGSAKSQEARTFLLIITQLRCVEFGLTAIDCILCHKVLVCYHQFVCTRSDTCIEYSS